MSINILSNSSANLSTELSGGILPYDLCTRWAGGYTASNGATGLISATGTTAATGTPYINSSNVPCAIPGTNKASLTGIFYPNGFTGTAEVWIYVKDASGVEGESNHLNYTALPSTSLVVYAGPDQSITSPPATITLSGATASNATGVTVWQWSADPLNPEPTYFTPDEFQISPDVGDFLTNGVYTFNLLVTDSIGQTGTDSMTVTVTGNEPSPSALDWTAGLTGVNNLPSFYIQRRRGGVTTYLVNPINTLGNTGGSIPIGSGSNELQNGDQIRSFISAVNGGESSGESSVFLRLEQQLRIPPYTINIVTNGQYNDTDPLGSIVQGYVKTVAPHWHTIDTTNYRYIITATSSVI
jgi:hypothetical protein